MMAMDRRQFLKITGWSALLGLGGKTAFQWLAPGEAEAALEQATKLAGKKWGMALDVTLLDEEIMSKCIQACHAYYNVPNIGNSKEEIKWLWKETYDHSFPGQENEYLADKFKGEISCFCATTAPIPPAAGLAPPKPRGRGKTAS